MADNVMQREEAPAAIPSKFSYDGSACLNARSVISVCELLSGKNAAEPITWPQLSAVLWFVETCVTSKGLFFDGTLPRATADGALDAVGRLKECCDVKDFGVQAIVPGGPRETLKAACTSMAESKLLVESFALRPEVDQPVDQKESEVFFERLEYALSLAPADREDLALQWVADGFRGSKCLAALAMNGDLLARARGLYENTPGSPALISAALINRFRLNYVNYLAASKRSAYIPDPAFEGITNDHIRLFQHYLLDQLSTEIKSHGDEPNVLVENMQSSAPLPSIGLYALLATKAANRPGAILETAYNEFRQDDSLMQLIWSHTRGGIALRKDKSATDFVPAVEQHFYDSYKVLEKQAAGINVLSKKRSVRSYLVPAVFKALAAALPKALGVQPVWEVVYSVLRDTATEASIPFLSDRLQGRDCDSYITQYKSLKWDFQHDPSLRIPLAGIAEHAERVFGRKITVGA
jgi:hypothetical protein